MERTFIKNVSNAIGQDVSIAGWIDVRRDHGKLIFLDLRDGTGIVQCVVSPNSGAALEEAKELRGQWVVRMEGEVKTRPENMRTEGPLGGIELAVSAIEVLSRAQELPFDLSADLNLDTRLDNLPLTLRTQRSRDIFSAQARIVEAYRSSLRSRGFAEFQAPALVGSDAEGGAAVFKVEYFNDMVAYLATSPQLYKQIMVGPFERVFTIAKIFRAEKSATTRHIAELTQMDFEMGFIQDHRDVMKMLQEVVRDSVNALVRQQPEVFARFATTAPLMPDEIPTLTLREAQKILGVAEESDLEPEHERAICAWALKERNSDFVFITHYPTKKRAFYTYEDPTEAPFSRSFDLLFRGLEINSGAQRLHNYDTLVERIKERGMDPKKFSFYLQAFKYGMPPHGGCSTGLERFTARMLELPNVKEAAAFPRDMTRIDSRLSEAPEFES